MFSVFLPSRETAVDSPVIAGVTSTVQLLQPHKGHMVRGQTGYSVFGCRAKVNPIEAAATDIGDGLVVVGFGIPGIAAVLLLAQVLPHITNSGGQAHLGHLRRSPNQTLLSMYTLQLHV